MIISFVLYSFMIKLSVSGNTQRSSAHGGFNTLWSHAVIWQPQPCKFLLKHDILHCCGFLFLSEMVTVMLLSSLMQGSSMQQRRKTGRRPTPTSLRPSRVTTLSTAPEPSQHSNTCSCAKLYSTCK